MNIFADFGIQPTLLFAQIINFLIILLLLNKFLFKPISKILEERKKRIEVSLKNADLIEEKLNKTEEQSKKIILQAQAEAQMLIDNAKKEAQSAAEKASADARKTIEDAKEQAKVQIETDRITMKQKLEKETLELVVAVVKKVLSRNLKQSEKELLTAQANSRITKQIK